MYRLLWPLSCSFSIPMILFVREPYTLHSVRLLDTTDSTKIWRTFRGSDHLIQTVVIGKTPGHHPASLQLHGNIMASLELLQWLEQELIAAAHNDLMAKIASVGIDTKAKRRQGSKRLRPPKGGRLKS